MSVAKEQDYGARISALDADLRNLSTAVQGLATNAEKQWSALSKMGEQLHEIGAAVKSAPKLDVTKLMAGALAVGSLIAMLVGGITYIVSGSQQPQLDRMRSDLRLLEFRLTIMERGAPALPSDRGPRANLSFTF
jgi:uncharacterized coiled-coil protein SlyX